jgi:hypothetical protein
MLGILVSVALSPPAYADEKDKASFDAVPDSDSPILQFRSLSVGIYPDHSLELDFYLSSRWGVGASLYGESDYCYDNPGTCRQTTGLGAHAERFFGGRWAHIGLRVGAFATAYSTRQRSILDGSLVSRNGGHVGAQFGLTATFTPTRWTGLSVTLLGMPGFFEGFKSSGRVNSIINLDEDDGRPTRELLFTGLLTVGVRFGVLDGPSPICRCCEDASLPCGD